MKFKHMLQKSKDQSKLKTSYFVISLFLFLAASAIFLHFIMPATNVVEAQSVIRQAAGPAVEGQWQPTDPLNNDYQLWRYRRDSGSIIIGGAKINNYSFWDNHYLEPCTITNPTPPPAFINTTCRYNPNQSPLENNLDQTQLANGVRTDFASGWADKIRNQEPYLVIGHDGANPAGSGDGFYGPELSLDLWVPAGFNISALSLIEDEFCYAASYAAWDQNGSSRDDQIYIAGNNGQQLLLSNAAGGACSSSAFATPNPGVIGGPIDAKNLFISGSSQNYENYKIIIRTSLASFYVNQFRLQVATPTSSYLLITETQSQGQQFSAISDGANAMGISNRLPEAYRRLEVLWEASINIASPPEQGCHGSDKLKVGIYDHDYNLLQTSWIGAGKFAPTIEIFETDRLAYSANPRAAPFSLVARYQDHDESKKRALAANAWDTLEYDFEYDKVYKIRFSNITQRSWIQIGVPYDQINALQNCVYAPLVKVFYSDVSAGGRFGLGEASDACRHQNDVDLEVGVYAGLYGNIRGRYPDNIKDSSSAEYGVKVRDQILSFYSNFKSTALPNPNIPTGLTFANYNTPYYGGNFGKSRCIPNYWRGAHGQTFTDIQSQDIADTAALIGPQTIFSQPTTARMKLTNRNLTSDLNLKATIYVDGDLLIENDIYNNSSGTQWKNFNDINYITIIVKGDILIDPSVSQIDAVLIAYPNQGTDIHKIGDDNKGRIYTCYPTGVDINDETLSLNTKLDLSISNLILNSKTYNTECSAKKLTVNGALIAREIHLGRTYIEPLDTIGSYVSEEINLLPEYFIGIPNLPGFEDWLHRSDSIHILPVNF